MIAEWQRSTAMTDPEFPDFPSMIAASSCRIPSSFGKPPNPTDVTDGSNSTLVMPATTAFSADCPALSTFTAVCNPSWLNGQVPTALFTMIGQISRKTRSLCELTLVVLNWLGVCLEPRPSRHVPPASAEPVEQAKNLRGSRRRHGLHRSLAFLRELARVWISRGEGLKKQDRKKQFSPLFHGSNSRYAQPCRALTINTRNEITHKDLSVSSTWIRPVLAY
mmetsp:Transcript_1773/g.3063  ORF Transcript_1773/g.3063 Transcript_1773/m.3063 type:complete len:221 (-) Transcript_1773:1080-1742(-)